MREKIKMMGGSSSSSSSWSSFRAVIAAMASNALLILLLVAAAPSSLRIRMIVSALAASEDDASSSSLSSESSALLSPGHHQQPAAYAIEGMVKYSLPKAVRTAYRSFKRTADVSETPELPLLVLRFFKGDGDKFDETCMQTISLPRRLFFVEVKKVWARTGFWSHLEELEAAIEGSAWKRADQKMQAVSFMRLFRIFASFLGGVWKSITNEAFADAIEGPDAAPWLRDNACMFFARAVVLSQANEHEGVLRLLEPIYAKNDNENEANTKPSLVPFARDMRECFREKNYLSEELGYEELFSWNFQRGDVLSTWLNDAYLRALAEMPETRERAETTFREWKDSGIPPWKWRAHVDQGCFSCSPGFDVPGHAWWDENDPWFQAYPSLTALKELLEENYELIRDEIYALGTDGFDETLDPMLGSSWREYLLYNSEWDDAKCRNMPHTCSLLKANELVSGTSSKLNEYASSPGQVTVYRLGPHDELEAHTGMINARLTAHLGIDIPRGCTIRVGNVTKTWEKGRVTFFDDSFTHEVRNPTDFTRVVFNVNFWHPALGPFSLPEDALSVNREEL